MRWVILGIAIAGEVIGTLRIGTSEGFSKDTVRSVLIVAASYGVSLFCLSFMMRQKMMELSVLYAVWVALGVAAIAVLSALVLHEAMPPLKIAFLALIVIGTVGLTMLEGN